MLASANELNLLGVASAETTANHPSRANLPGSASLTG